MTITTTEIEPADILWDDPEADNPDRDFTEEEMQAVESSELYTLSDDFSDSLFGNTIRRDGFHKEDVPFGWDLTDHIDWDSLDYEGNAD